MVERCRALAVCAVLSLWLGTVMTALAAPVVDDQGQAINLPRTPQRVVSLLPALTETVCALGACERLVGVDTYSNWPVSVRVLPRTSGMEDASIELIVSWRPDVVLLARSSRLMERLQALGIPVLALEPTQVGDVPRTMQTLARLLDLPDADAQAARLWQRVDAGIARAAAELPSSRRGTRVYLEVDAGPYAASESSFIGQIMQRLGLSNIVPATLGPFPRLNPEFVVRADPEVIMLSERTTTALAQRPGWARIRAVRDGRICAFSREQGDLLVRPGPRLDQAARLMLACVLARPAGGGG